MNKALVSVLVLGVSLIAKVLMAQSSVPLNTGYNYAIYGPYPAVTATASATKDDYWINIASYPPTTPAIAPAWVLQSPTSWFSPLPSSNWISARNKAASDPSTYINNPSYTLFRKCFCLSSGYSNPQISFVARADDMLQVWLNSQVNVLLPPQSGNFNGVALPSLPSNPAWFHGGLNCVYALVEDTYGGLMGFNLEGTVQANGLGAQPAFGVNQTFSCPCATDSGSNPTLGDIDGGHVVTALVEIAEQRRLQHIRELR